MLLQDSCPSNLRAAAGDSSGAALLLLLLLLLAFWILRLLLLLLLWLRLVWCPTCWRPCRAEIRCAYTISSRSC